MSNLKAWMDRGQTLDRALAAETESLMYWERCDFRKSIRNLHEAYLKLGGDYGGERFTTGV